MTRRARIAITALGKGRARDTAADTAAVKVTAQNNVDQSISLLQAAGAAGADLALLPEAFALTDLGSPNAREVAEELSGPAFDRVAQQAREHSMNVVAGFEIIQDGELFNVAAVISRTGDLIGTYRKRYLTFPEMDAGIHPGESTNVFDTDIGRIGVAICFDINWPALWKHFEDEKVDLVCWISAYDGGFPLRSYAWVHQYPIATSVMSDHARIIDVSGDYLASTSRWTQLAICDVSLDRQLFHIDEHADDILELQQHYGDRIHIQGHSEENVFSLETVDETLSIDEVIAAHSLSGRRAYLQRAEAARNQYAGVSQ